LNFKEKYQEEMSAVDFSEAFCENTVRLMQQTAHRKENEHLKRKPLKVILITAVIMALLSVTAFAVTQYLSAKEVAEYLGDKEIAALFKENECEPQTVSNGTYDVTFLGKTTGTLLNMTEDFEAEETRSYAVIAIRRTDGTPLSTIDGMPVQPVPVIEGYMPFRTWGVMESASGMQREGVLYYLFNYENLEIFADCTVSIALIEGAAFPTPEVLTMDEKGKIVYADGYEGIKGIFDLPMDKSKADPEAAAKILSNY